MDVLLGCPAIISAPYPETPPFNMQYVAIFETPTSNNPWIMVRPGDATYGWFFDDAFLPNFSSTHLIAVDLHKLAGSRFLEPQL